MVLRMKNFTILGFPWKIRILGGRFTKNQYRGGDWLKSGGFGHFVDLRGTLQERREWCFRYPNAHYESGAKFEEKLGFCFEMMNFDLSTKRSKNLHFDWSLLRKLNNVWTKKEQGSIFHDTEESCKIWRKTDLWFGIMT